MLKLLTSFVILVFFIGLIAPSYAHTTVEVEQYKIEVGWGIEPPIVGIRNDIVFKITESGETKGTYRGVTSVFKEIDATIFFGGASKKIDISSDVKPGYYFSHIIPTKTGTYTVQLSGMLNGIIIDVTIPVEDMESTAVLDFPPSSSSGGTDNVALKNTVSSLQQEIAIFTATPTNPNEKYTLEIAVGGLSIASVAIILAIVSLVKRK